MFHYYLLGGYTVAPSTLYARLCHAFLVYSDLQVPVVFKIDCLFNDMLIYKVL